MNPTQLLMDIITIGGTSCIDCGFCGRTWFVQDVEDLEEMRAKAKADPKKYVESSDDSLAFGWFEGKQVVFGCCEDKLKRYADWIWSNREVIAAYLKRRAKDEADEALRTLELMQ